MSSMHHDNQGAMTDWIADEAVIFAHADGRRVAGRIAVGVPVRVSASEARCAIALDGLDKIGVPICGSSPLQALLLALRFIGFRLHGFVSNGGRVLEPDETLLNLESVFGPLLVDPPDVAG
jgi:hypothetical protein